MKYSVLLTLLIGFSVTWSQQLSGVVINKKSKDKIPFASVYLPELGVGVSTNESGAFVFSGDFPEKVKIRVTAFGFEPFFEEINISEKQLVISLSTSHLKLPEVSVSSPVSDIQKENVVFIDARKIKDLNQISGTLGQALSNIPGVYESSTGQGISKPVIRGMQGIRVLTMLNGQRVESQQWGGDHGMVFTDLGIGSVEIVKGPASLMYGADALGGVAYFVDERYEDQGTHKIDVDTRFESASLGTTSKLQYGVSGKKARFKFAGLYSNHADYALPSGKYAGNSRYSNIGGKLAFGYNKKKWLINVRYAISQNRIGIPGHTHDSIPNPEDFRLETQERGELIPAQVIHNQLLSIENKWFLKKGSVNLLLGHAYNQLKEFEEKVVTPALNIQLHNSTYHLRWKHGFNKHLKLVSGLQGGMQLNDNGKAWADALIPDFNQLDNGVYSLLNYSKGKWSALLGGRYDLRMLEVFNSKYYGTFKRTYQSVNGSLGGVYAGKHNTVRLNVSTGYRGPHVSELTAHGVHHGVLRYELGDVNLVSEQAMQVDLSYEYGGEHLELILNPFFNRIANYIYANPQDSMVDGLPLFQYTQVPLAMLYGGDIGFHYHPHFAHMIHLEAAYSHIESDDGNGGYLALIPQNRVSLSLRFDLKEYFKKKFKILDLVVQYKYHLDRTRVAVDETWSPSYHLLNVAMNFQIAWKAPLEVGIGVRNVLNTSYIDHLSRLKNISLQHLGRNFYVQLKWTFTKG